MKLTDEGKKTLVFQKKLKYIQNAKEKVLKRHKDKIEQFKNKSNEEKKEYYEKKKINKFSKKMENLHKIDYLFYKNIWNCRKHFCKNCNKDLGCLFEDKILNNQKPINLYRYAHIIPKSTYPFLRHYDKNIFLLCLECHTKFDNSKLDEVKKMKIYDINLINNLKEFHKLLKDNNLNLFK